MIFKGYITWLSNIPPPPPLFSHFPPSKLICAVSTSDDFSFVSSRKVIFLWFIITNFFFFFLCGVIIVMTYLWPKGIIIGPGNKDMCSNVQIVWARENTINNLKNVTKIRCRKHNIEHGCFGPSAFDAHNYYTLYFTLLKILYSYVSNILSLRPLKIVKGGSFQGWDVGIRLSYRTHKGQECPMSCGGQAQPIDVFFLVYCGPCQKKVNCGIHEEKYQVRIVQLRMRRERTWFTWN